MKNNLTVFALLILLAGCSQQTRVSALFTTNTAIGSGSEVVYQETVIGEVERVSNEGAGTRVHLLLDAEKSGDLKQGSALLLTSDNGKRVAQIYNFRAGKEPLRNGDELVALNHMAEYLAWQTGEAVGLGQSLLSGATKSVEDYFNSEEWAQQKEDMRQSLSQLGADAEEAGKEMQKEYDALMQALEAQTEESREQIEKRFRELAEDLGQQIERSMQEGEKAVADSLRQLLEFLEEFMKKYPDIDKQRETAA